MNEKQEAMLWVVFVMIHAVFLFAAMMTQQEAMLWVVFVMILAYGLNEILMY